MREQLLDGARMSTSGWAAIRMWTSVLLSAAFLAGCGSNTSEKSADESGFEKTFDRGSFSVVIRIDNTEPTIADLVNLELTGFAEEGWEIFLPSFDERVGDFVISEASASQRELTESGQVRHSRIYELEPFLAGDYKIPPMIFGFTKKGEAEQQIETEEISISVTSILPEDLVELEINDIADPVELPAQSRALLWGVIIGSVVVIAGGIFLFWFFRIRNREKVGPPPVPPHVIAFAAIAELMGEDLPGRGEDKEFYSRISDILRRYIEGRFGIQAPGQTTEEFLRSQRGGSILQPAHQQLLGDFLKYSDLVKFAEQQPTPTDIRNAVDASKSFIRETHAVETTPAE
jgi:hypothetical protein